MLNLTCHTHDRASTHTCLQLPTHLCSTLHVYLSTYTRCNIGSHDRPDLSYLAHASTLIHGFSIQSIAHIFSCLSDAIRGRIATSCIGRSALSTSISNHPYMCHNTYIITIAHSVCDRGCILFSPQCHMVKGREVWVRKVFVDA